MRTLRVHNDKVYLGHWPQNHFPFHYANGPAYCISSTLMPKLEKFIRSGPCYNHLTSQTQLTPVSVPHMWHWKWSLLGDTKSDLYWVWLVRLMQSWRIFCGGWVRMFRMHRGKRTFTSTCNKYKHQDDVTLGAIIGTFANIYTSHGLHTYPCSQTPPSFWSTCSTQHTASGKKLCGWLRTMLRHGAYSFDLPFHIPETTLGYNLTDVPKMLNQLNVMELTRKQSRITLKNLVLHL